MRDIFFQLEKEKKHTHNYRLASAAAQQWQYHLGQIESV